MHSAEYDQYYQNETLSTTTSGMLLNQPLEISTRDAIQKELNAYFTITPETFAGVVYHADGSGPGKPYYSPSGEDWNPIVQAIARIGSQAEYWQSVASHLQNGLDFCKLSSAGILPIFPAENGRVRVIINSYPDFLINAAKSAGDTKAKYPKYIPTVDYGGDGDFYGTGECLIFPMSVRDLKGTFSDISRTAIGVTETNVQAVWNNWKNLDRTYNSIFTNAFKQIFVRLPYHQFEFINKKIQQGETFENLLQVTRAFVMNNRNITKEELNGIINFLKEWTKDEIKNPVLYVAYKKHADGLSDLYESAKANHRDLYHY